MKCSRALPFTPWFYSSELPNCILQVVRQSGLSNSFVQPIVNSSEPSNSTLQVVKQFRTHEFLRSSLCQPFWTLELYSSLCRTVQDSRTLRFKILSQQFRSIGLTVSLCGAIPFNSCCQSCALHSLNSSCQSLHCIPSDLRCQSLHGSWLRYWLVPYELFDLQVTIASWIRKSSNFWFVL